MGELIDADFAFRPESRLGVVKIWRQFKSAREIAEGFGAKTSVIMAILRKECHPSELKSRGFLK